MSGRVNETVVTTVQKNPNLVEVKGKPIESGQTIHDTTMSRAKQVVAPLFAGSDGVFNTKEANRINSFGVTNDSDAKEVRMYNSDSGATVYLKYNDNFSEFYQNDDYRKNVMKLINYASKYGGDVIINLRDNSLTIKNMDLSFEPLRLGHAKSNEGQVSFAENITLNNVEANVVELPRNTKKAIVDVERATWSLGSSKVQVLAGSGTDVSCTGDMDYDLIKYDVK